MTKRRLITLVGGVAVLALISYLRLSSEGPPPPERTGQPPAGLSVPKGPIVLGFSGKTMGTTYTVKYLPPAQHDRKLLEAEVEAALEAVNASMSTYDPKSEISVINASPAETPLPLSAPFSAVLTVASQVHDKTDGAFDVTVGPLVRVYGFGPDKRAPLPPEEKLSALKAAVGMAQLSFTPGALTLTKGNPDTELDFSGIAKGFGVDEVARTLEEAGTRDYMIEVGGEIRVRGNKAKDAPWVLAIEEPNPEARAIHGTLSLPASGGALATSGDYRNFHEVDGSTVSHTFDPRTKAPVPRRTASVSVVRPTATEADALATALGVLAPDTALSVSEKEGYAVYLLVHKDGGGFSPLMSSAFRKLNFKRLVP